MRLRPTQITLLTTTCLVLLGGPANTETLSLEGRVEHSESLVPLDGFRVGAQFDEALLPGGEACEGTWWRVPKWLKGCWHKTGRIDVLSFVDLKTNQPVPFKKRTHINYPNNEVIGHQVDHIGQVWTYVPTPTVMRTTQDNQTNVNVVNSFDLVDENENSITLRLFVVTVVVNNSNNKVISICQREQLQTWTTVNENEVTILDSTKYFDRDGEPIFARKQLSYTKKCAEFCPVNYISRTTHQPAPRQDYYIPESLRHSASVPFDLRASFTEYLRTHNLTLLIP